MKSNEKIEQKNFENTTSEEYQKLPVSEILHQSHDIDPVVAADQIIKWATANVEQFIDNQRKIYKLDIIIDAESGDEETMPEIKKLQDLFRAIPDDSVTVSPENLDTTGFADIDENQYQETIKCRDTLNRVSDNIFKALQGHDGLQELFKRMIFFYEMKGVSYGKPLIDELDGGVDILKFEYESFPVGVKVMTPPVEVVKEDGTTETVQAEVAKEYVIPEGFTLWIEISYRSKMQTMNSLF